MKKRILSLVLALALTLPLFCIPASAATASFTVTLSASNVIVGNQVNVNIRLKGSENLGYWKFVLHYDPACLEYISGADAGGGGAVRFANVTANANGDGEVNYTVKFKTLKISSTTVRVSPTEIFAFSGAAMGTGEASRTIQINAAPTLSGDNQLKELSVAQGAIEPAFDPNVTEYSLSVPFSEKNLTVSATPAHGAASVALSSTELAVGDNVVTVTVKAQNGATKQYVLRVHRAESNLAGVTANVNGTQFVIEHDPAYLTPPAGYTEVTVDYGTREILAYASPNATVHIVYLKSDDPAAAAGWYLFDQQKQSFYPMHTATSSTEEFVFLPLPETLSVPAGFSPKQISVSEQIVFAYQNAESETSGVYLVYAMNKDGLADFYYYDLNRNSFVSYFASSAQVGSDIPSDSELLSRTERAEAKAKKMQILVLSLSILVVLLAIGIALVFVYRRRPKEEEKIDPYDEALFANETDPKDRRH